MNILLFESESYSNGAWILVCSSNGIDVSVGSSGWFLRWLGCRIVWMRIGRTVIVGNDCMEAGGCVGTGSTDTDYMYGDYLH